MTKKEFIDAIGRAFPVGDMFDNLGGGTTRIVRNESRTISYLRGHSTITVGLSDLFKAYDHFRGRRMSSKDLRQFAPSVFDSGARPAGHSCNCTFLFQVLQRIGLVDGDIGGRGVSGDPYFVQLR